MRHTRQSVLLLCCPQPDVLLIFEPYPAGLHSYGISAAPTQFFAPLLNSSIHPAEKRVVLLDVCTNAAGRNTGGNATRWIDVGRAKKKRCYQLLESWLICSMKATRFFRSIQPTGPWVLYPIGPRANFLPAPRSAEIVCLQCEIANVS